MANDAEDIITEQHAVVLARDYGFCPYDPLKCERCVTHAELCSVFFANTSNIAKCFIQYTTDELEAMSVEGDACAACWSADKQWEDETVPKYVFCSLSGFDVPVEFLNAVFEPGEPIKVGYYLLEQQNAPDCTYEYLNDDVEIIWTPDDIESTILVTTKPDDVVRMNASAGGCFKRFEQNGTHAEINYC